MKLPQYEFQTEPELMRYLFVSKGIKGEIEKVVVFTEIVTEEVYNLAFGDYNRHTNTINDLSVTNNGDSIKVLATVAAAMFDFISKHPKAKIFATGSTTVRTRLYRMGITNNLAEISENFAVFGLDKYKNWNNFIVGEDYEAFLITKKENIL